MIKNYYHQEQTESGTTDSDFEKQEGSLFQQSQEQR